MLIFCRSVAMLCLKEIARFHCSIDQCTSQERTNWTDYTADWIFLFEWEVEKLLQTSVRVVLVCHASSVWTRFLCYQLCGGWGCVLLRNLGYMVGIYGTIMQYGTTLGIGYWVYGYFIYGWLYDFVFVLYICCSHAIGTPQSCWLRHLSLVRLEHISLVRANSLLNRACHWQSPTSVWTGIWPSSGSKKTNQKGFSCQRGFSLSTTCPALEAWSLCCIWFLIIFCTWSLMKTEFSADQHAWILKLSSQASIRILCRWIGCLVVMLHVNGMTWMLSCNAAYKWYVFSAFL